MERKTAIIPIIVIIFVLVGGCGGATPGDTSDQSTATPPAPTLAPTATPAWEGSAITLDGDGPQASAKFHLDEGLSIFRMTHSGSSRYVVWLLDSYGHRVDLLANATGSFDGGKAEGLTMGGDYYLNITADGPWAVAITQPRPASAPAVPAVLSGHGQQVSPFFSLGYGVWTFRMAHDGASSFVVWLDDAQGNHVELLANAAGRFEGSKAVGIPAGGIYLLDIQADGSWKIEAGR